MKDLSELIVSGLILQAALLKKGFKMEVEEPAKRRDKAYERVTWR